MIYDSFRDIADRFDTLLIDAYGVFWDGSAPILDTFETMAEQVHAGKQVCILSNTTIMGKNVIDSYTHRGLIQGTHYTNIITSGEVFYYHLCHHRLSFPGNKVYILGISRWDITKGTDFQIVSSPHQADIVLFATPQLMADYLIQHPEFRKIANLVKGTKDIYDVENVTPFLNDLKTLAKLDLPAVSTNPDLIACENGHWNIRQGTFAQTYRDLGGRVEEFGKPYRNIYQYAFQKLGITPSSRVAMIGDTFRTDIRGALDNGITPVWCIDTGVARYEMDHGHTLEDQAGGTLDGIYLVHHL